jgi:Mrp family chromosome partitioning ATPase
MPDEGKSTVSVSLASAAALAGSRVLLVECDLRRPSLSTRLGVKSNPGLTDYLQGAALPQDLLQMVPLTPPAGAASQPSAKPIVTSPHPSPRMTSPSTQRKKGGKPQQPQPTAPSMVVISAGSPVTNAPELLQSKRFEDFLDKVSRAYDLVVLDGSPLLSVADPLELAADADGVLLCIRVQRTTRDQARASVAALGHLPERPSGIVVTGLKRGDETYQYYYGY